MQGSSNSIYSSYHIGWIFHANDDNSYNLHLYVRDPNSIMIYAKPTYNNSMIFPHSKIRFVVWEEMVDIDQKIVLNNLTVEIIVKTCFNGSNQLQN